MHGYKNVSPHNYPGLRFENAGKQREHLWRSRQQSADKACVIKAAVDKKQIERR